MGGCDRVVPTPGSPTNWTSPFSRSRPSSASRIWRPTATNGAAPRRRGRPARRGRRGDRRRARGGGRASAPRRRRARRRGGRPQGRRGGGRRGRRRRRTRPRTTREAQARAAAAAADALAAPQRRPEPARGHLRPRRGGLRPVARPRRAGRSGLRRALGGPPPRRDHDRGGPDRDPPRRRRRGRRRRLIRAARAIAWRRARARASLRRGRAVGARHGAALHRRCPTAGTTTACASRAPDRRRRRRGADPRGRRAAGAASQHRQIEVVDEATGARLRPRLRGARAGASSGSRGCERAGPPPAGADFEEVPFPSTRAAADRVVHTLPWMTTTAAIAALRRRTRTRWAPCAARARCVARDDGGTPVGYVSFGARRRRRRGRAGCT